MNKDILDQLQEEARRLRVARTLPEGKLSWDLVARVQEDFRAFKEKHSLSLSDIAKRLGPGFSSAVLSSFLSMDGPEKYIGDTDRVVRGVNAFMEQFVRAKESPRPTGFVETRVAKRMLTTVQHAVELRAIGLIYGPSGIGKSLTLQAAHSMFPGSIMMRTRSTTRTAGGLAKQLAEEMKVRATTTYQIQRKLIESLQDTDRPLFVDEAHQLHHGALEFLRDLHDECGIPMVLAGTAQLEKAVSDTDIWYGQFSSRTALRCDLIEHWNPDSRHKKPLFSVEEIRKVFQSDKVRLTDDGALMLMKVANCMGIGCLRLCRQVVFVAAKLSDQPLDAAILSKVMRQMHGEFHNEKRIDKSIIENAPYLAVA